MNDKVISSSYQIAKHSKKIFSNKLFWLVLILLLIFVGLMVTFSVLNWPDTAGLTVIISFICAIIGAFVTMLITEKQLENQSEYGLETQKNSKVFEERLSVYKEYINTISKILTQNSGILTDSDQLNLEFATALLALHINGESLKSIALDIKAIIDERDKQNGKVVNEQLISHLLNIVIKLKEHLYDGTKKEIEINEEDKKEIETIFNDAYDIQDMNSSESLNTIKEDLPSLKRNESDENVEDFNLVQWNRAVEKWGYDGWQVLEGWKKNPEEQWFNIERKDGSPGKICNGRRNFKPCIMVSYGQDREFSYDMIVNPPQGINNAQRKTWLWWTDDKILGDEGHLVEQMQRNPALQDFLINLIEESMQRIENWGKLDNRE